jgi:hypothetical protein
MGKSVVQKQEEAKKRQEKRDKISAKDQIAILDSRFGKNIGAKKEREKLINIINKEQEPKEKPKKEKSKKNKNVD